MARQEREMHTMQSRQVGHWVIISKLGGNMGEVWLGRDILLNHRVAIKSISQNLLHDPQFETRFIQEASAQARLQHPHIVGVSDFFLDDGVYYLVMPFIEGPSLEEHLAASKGPLPLAEALRIAQEVLQALDYAHQQKVIHRDVKPSNILLDRSGHAYLVDFGIALTIGQERRTRTGSSIGTTHYMSPEQIRRPRDVDHRTDVYSFGCVLYEMLTGRPPFDADDEEGDTDFVIKGHHLNSAPDPPSRLNASVPAAIDAIVLRALAKNMDQRFMGCGEFARALQELAREEESLIRCPYCSSPNPLKKERLAQAACRTCGQQLLAASEQSHATKGKLWKAATLLLGMAVLVLKIGWSDANEQLKAARKSSSKYSSDLEQTKKEKGELAAKMSKTEVEQTVRANLFQNWPVTIAEVRLGDEKYDGESPGDQTRTFKHDDVQYILWYARLLNNMAGIKPLKGTLLVKVFKPNDSSDDMSANYEIDTELNIDGKVPINGRWDNIGQYRIEFWWSGRNIGETSFSIE